nr:LptA/OstA family protein [Deinococcus maricopensis]
MKRTAVLTALTLTGATLAATADRILKFESKIFQGDLRNGPWTFTGKPGAPVKANVSTLGITAQKAVLSAPSGTPITSAEGKRNATFDGSVVVTRGRLTAKGGSLTYSEADGQGVLKNNPSAVFVPDKTDGGDPVNISAQAMSLDVDNNISTSTGGVKLVNGNQTGASDKLVFDETKELGAFTGNVRMNRAAKGSQKELVITGTEARILTKGKLMYVRGGVKLVQGDVTTTGNAMYYDDKKNVAYVIGNAVSVDAKNKTTVKAPASGALEQRTDLARVRTLPGGFKIPEDQFRVTGEK